jgi:hypothetical protein
MPGSNATIDICECMNFKAGDSQATTSAELQAALSACSYGDVAANPLPVYRTLSSANAVRVDILSASILDTNWAWELWHAHRGRQPDTR